MSVRGRTGLVLGMVALGIVVSMLVVAVVVFRGEEPYGAAGVDLPSLEVPTPPASPPPTEGSVASADPDEPDSSEEDREPSPAPPLSKAPPAGQGDLPDATAVVCPDATTTVNSAEELAEALVDAAPGDAIELQDGEYAGGFATTASGTEQQPIFLCGSAAAVLNGGDEDDGYTFHLDGASYWRLVGFTVRGGQKGVMADGTVGSVIQSLTVRDIGDEAIHLRSNSTDNVVRGNTISNTGLRREEYGEGVYLGTAVSNWCTYTDCEADRSDRNVVIGNTITAVSSEAVDVKEGTTGGVIADNVFDGAAVTGADSWVDIKGNNYLISGNVGTNAPEDGFQTHQILDGWGDHNLFSGNDATVRGPGSAISSWPELSNVVTCDNTFREAGEGLSNIECT